MLGGLPYTALLLALPFVSAGVVAATPPLLRVAAVYHRVTWPLGIIGLCCLVAALVGLVSPPLSLPVAISGGAVSGFAVFSVRRDENEGDKWRWGDPSPDDPPPDPADEGPIDWELFDRLRAGWARSRVRAR